MFAARTLNQLEECSLPEGTDNKGRNRCMSQLDVSLRNLLVVWKLHKLTDGAEVESYTGLPETGTCYPFYLTKLLASDNSS